MMLQCGANGLFALPIVNKKAGKSVLVGLQNKVNVGGDRFNNNVNGLNNIGLSARTTDFYLSNRLPVSNVFANYWLRAYEKQDLLECMCPEFWLSMLSHLVNLKMINNNVFSRGNILELHVEYIDKAQQKVLLKMEYKATLQKLKEGQEFWKELYSQEKTALLDMFAKMDIVETMKEYLKQAEMQTAGLLYEGEFEAFLSKNTTLTEKKAIIQGLMDDALGFRSQDVVDDDRLFAKPNSNAAEQFYSQGIKNGLNPEVIAIMQSNSAEISFAFRSIEMLQEIFSVISRAAERRIVNAYQDLMVAICRLDLDNSDDWTKVPHMLHNLEGLRILLEEAGLFQNNILGHEKMREYLKTYCKLPPGRNDDNALDALLQKMHSNLSTTEKAAELLKAYGIDVAVSNVNSGSVTDLQDLAGKLLNLIEAYKIYKTAHVGITYKHAMREQNADQRYLPGQVYYIMIPIDNQLKFEYTGMAEHVDVRQKLSVLALLDVWNDSDKAFFKSMLNPLSDWDYSNVDMSKLNVSHAQLGNKTIEEYVSAMCKSDFWVSKYNKPLFTIWEEKVQDKYYDLEEKWQSSVLGNSFVNADIPVARVLFETVKYDKIFSQKEVDEKVVERKNIGLRPVLAVYNIDTDGNSVVFNSKSL